MLVNVFRVLSFSPIKTGLLRSNLLALCLVFLSVIGAQAQAQSLSRFEKVSDEFRPYFIELFTSQGCSSCPPADAWLSEFTQEKGLWQEYFPIAFHVSYWDYIGWKDPYASRRFSQRQYDHLNLLNIRQVYTPQFVVNGKEWKGWFKRIFGNTFEQPKTKVGSLSTKLVDGQLDLSFSSIRSLDDTKVTLHLALLGADLLTRVTRGENRNKQLKHDFTVLNHQVFQPQVNDNFASYSGPMAEILDAETLAPKLALVIWAEVDGKPLQAVASWLEQS